MRRATATSNVKDHAVDCHGYLGTLAPIRAARRRSVILKRIYITQQMIDRYASTQRCPQGEHYRPSHNHSERCRRRIEAEAPRQ